MEGDGSSTLKTLYEMEDAVIDRLQGSTLKQSTSERKQIMNVLLKQSTIGGKDTDDISINLKDEQEKDNDSKKTVAQEGSPNPQNSQVAIVETEKTPSSHLFTENRLNKKKNVQSVSTKSDSNSAVSLIWLESLRCTDKPRLNSPPFSKQLPPEGQQLPSQPILSINFARNILCSQFGRLPSNQTSISDEILEELEPHRVRLVKSLRCRAWLFVLLNGIWSVAMCQTKISALSWLPYNKGLDEITVSLLSAAQNISIAQLVVWGLSICIGFIGILMFSTRCLKIYQYGVILSIIDELVMNMVILNLVPFAIAQCFIVILSHCFFIFAARTVQNGMTLFQSEYLDVITKRQPQHRNLPLIIPAAQTDLTPRAKLSIQLSHSSR